MPGELLLTELPRVTEYTDLRRWPVPGNKNIYSHVLNILSFYYRAMD